MEVSRVELRFGLLESNRKCVGWVRTEWNDADVVKRTGAGGELWREICLLFWGGVQLAVQCGCGDQQRAKCGDSGFKLACAWINQSINTKHFTFSKVGFRDRRPPSAHPWIP